jgi:hypothetical protein
MDRTPAQFYVRVAVKDLRVKLGNEPQIRRLNPTLSECHPELRWNVQFTTRYAGRGNKCTEERKEYLPLFVYDALIYPALEAKGATSFVNPFEGSLCVSMYSQETEKSQLCTGLAYITCL